MDVLTLDKGQYSGSIHRWKEYRGLISSKTAYDGQFNASFHSHEHPHLSFILQGGNVEYRKKQTVIRNTNEVMFYHSGELHKTIPTDSQTRNLNLEIDAAFLQENSISEDRLKQVVQNNRDSSLFILKMQSEIHLNDHLTESALHALLFGFITAPELKSYKEISWCIKLNQLLNDQWNQQHNLSDLAAQTGVHPVTISKYFASYFGCTLGEYLRKLRVSKSLSLIKNPGYSLTEIALLCGFSDQSHFIRVFKHYTGISPKNYRSL